MLFFVFEQHTFESLFACFEAEDVCLHINKISGYKAYNLYEMNGKIWERDNIFCQ